MWLGKVLVREGAIWCSTVRCAAISTEVLWRDCRSGVRWYSVRSIGSSSINSGAVGSVGSGSVVGGCDTAECGTSVCSRVDSSVAAIQRGFWCERRACGVRCWVDQSTERKSGSRGDDATISIAVADCCIIERSSNRDNCSTNADGRSEGRCNEGCRSSQSVRPVRRESVRNWRERVGRIAKACCSWECGGYAEWRRCAEWRGCAEWRRCTER